MNALTVHRLGGMGRQGWRAEKPECGPASSIVTLGAFQAPLPPWDSPWTNLVLRATRRERERVIARETARTRLRLLILLRILSCREHP